MKGDCTVANERCACANGALERELNFKTFPKNDPPFSPFKEQRRQCDNSVKSSSSTSGSRLIVRAYTSDADVRKALKNLLVLSVAFCLLFTAYVSLRGLQSSLNSYRGGLSLSCVHAATIVSCLFAPIVIDKLTSKWTLVATGCVFLLYVATNIYPYDSTVAATSLLFGLFIGPLWCAQGTYLTTLSLHYADVTGQSVDVTVPLFNGIFTGLFQSSQVWGNLLSAAVVVVADNRTIASQIGNNSTLLRVVCGAMDCGGGGGGDDFKHTKSAMHEIVTSYAPPPPPTTTDTRNVLFAVYVVCVFPAIALLALLLDPVVNTDSCAELDATSAEHGPFTHQIVLATLKTIFDQRLLLLVPLVVFTGLQQGFILSDFTKSYVSCELGVHKIGTVLMSYGGVSAICAVFVGHLAFYIKRYPTVLCGAVCNAGLLVVVLWWRPCSDDVAMFYVIAGCFGLCDAIWQTQATTLFGILFRDNQEAAFSCFRMFQSAGFAIAFGYSHVLCGYTKIYVLALSMALTIVLYSIVERRCQREKRYRQSLVVL